MDLFILDGTKACGGSTCQTGTLMDDTGVAEATFAVKSGQAYHVVVDGYDGYAGSDEIEAACSCQ